MGETVETVEFVDAESGHTFVKCEIGTGDLKNVTIDTYQMFPVGMDRFEESEIEYLEETYTGSGDLGYDDFGWSYNSELWKKMLSETLIRYLLEEQPEPWIKAIEFEETTSPREYNFETDKMYAVFTVDVTELRQWWSEQEFTFEEEMGRDGRHGSCDGYISFIDSRYRDDRIAIETMMMLDRWIESWSKWDHFVMFMHEHMTGNGEDLECIDYWPNTNAGLLAWVQADRAVEDEWINDFAAREVNVEDLRVGDRLVTDFEGFRTVTAVRREERNSVVGIGVNAPHSDGSGEGLRWYAPGTKMFRAFDPERDLK